MTRTGRKMRSGCAALATSCAWGILILAGQPLAAPLAQAQSATSTPTLHGGVQQSTTTGDVFNGRDSGPTNTNQPGVGGSPACHQIDPECGGTNRQCYDQAYHSTGIVMSVAQSQSLYQQTRGQIWIRCGACRSNVICWPRPGYQDLIAGRAGDPAPGPGAANNMPNVDDTMKNVVASCATVLRQQGSLRNRPGCLSGSVLEWCKKFQDNSGCVAIVADAGGDPAGQQIVNDGSPNAGPAPTRAAQPVPSVPMPVPVVGKPVTGGPPGTPGAAGGTGGTSGPAAPLQGGVQQIDLKPVVFVNGNGRKTCYFDPAKPYYNYFAKGHEVMTIDLSQHGILDVHRTLKSKLGTADRKGTITPNCDATGYIESLNLQVAGGGSYKLEPSNIHGVAFY
jgi:hypothetical protein